MSDNFRFSIVVPFFNESAKIGKAVEAISRIRWDANDFEVILVDNMSTDKSREICEHHLSAVKHKQLLSCETHRSSYAARNTGWRLARGKYIVFIDADCIADQNILLEYDRAILSDTSNQVGIYAGCIEPFRREDATNIELYSAERKLLNQDSAVKGWAYRPFAQTANAAFPREVLDRVGGFNPYLTSGGDGELCWRILDQADLRLEYCKNARVFHWHRESLSDLFFQFEKYGVGRFQQCAVVPDFDKGLIGITKQSIIESLEALEAKILINTSDTAQKEILWQLYDSVSKVSNSVGYLGAKSSISNALNETNIFAKPRFEKYCSLCEIPNLAYYPSFAKHGPTTLEEDTCGSCGAQLVDRLLHAIGRREDNNKDIDRRRPDIVYVDSKEIFSLAKTDNADSIYVINNVSDVAEIIYGARWAVQRNAKLLLLATSINSRGEVGKMPFHLAGVGDHGCYRDDFSGKVLFFSYISPSMR